MSAEKRMMGYLPPYWHESAEMQQILRTAGAEIDTLNKKIECIYLDAFIMTAGESRIAEWEKWLKLPPAGTLDERRRRVLSYFQVFVKLNEGVIKTLVAVLYRDARAKVTFADGEIKIIVIPWPENYLDTDTALLVEQLETKKPCHIGIAARRFQCTWGDINNSFATWAAAKTQRPTWRDIMLHIPDDIEI